MKGNWSCNSTFETHLLPPIYGVELCVALVGNILALWLLVTKEKKNWHMGVVFSCNLVICDILYALTRPLLIHYYSKEREWVFGDAVCKIERFLFTCNLYVSIYFIMSISVHQYLAVVHPIFTRKHIRPKHAKIISLLVWMLVASITSPILYYSGGLENMKGNWSCNSTFSRDLLPPIYGVEMCVALVGNILALWLLVTKEKKNWHMGVVFSCNLVICDILYALTLPLLIHYYSRGRKWVFGEAVCKIERFLFICNLYVSIYFIMCISVHRYLAVVYPIFTRKRVRPKHARIISVFVWIFVASISSPIFYFSGINKGKCSLFANIQTNADKSIYRVFMAVIGCLIPFVVTFASYFGIIMAVFKNSNITLLQKKKVALIVGLGCVLYTVSFVPYHILQMLCFKSREKHQNNCYVHIGYQVSKALACLNMCLHPILYMAMFDSIRAMCSRRSSDVSTFDITVGEHSSKDYALKSID